MWWRLNKIIYTEHLVYSKCSISISLKIFFNLYIFFYFIVETKSFIRRASTLPEVEAGLSERSMALDLNSCSGEGGLKQKTQPCPQGASS